MNSFKKVSIATAAALAIMAVSAVPTLAAPLAVTVASSSNATTNAAPATIAVPSANQITSGTSVALTATADTGTVVSFVASPTVKLVTALHTADAPKTVASGVSTHSVTSAGVAITVYAYTTTTAVGFVTITNGAYSTIVYIKGIASTAAKVSVSVPSATAVGTVPTITVLATDVFGNAVLTGETVTVTVIGSTFADGTITKALVTATTAEAVADTTLVAGSKTAALATAVAGTISVTATGALTATAVTGLDAPVKAVQTSFTVSDLNGTIAVLTAQLNAERNARALEAQSAAIILATEKAARAADKVAADKALADEKSAHASTKVEAADKAKADAATIASFKKRLAAANKLLPASKRK